MPIPHFPKLRRLSYAALCLYFAALFISAARAESNAESRRVLTSVAQIRALTNAEAAKGYPVHLRALITFHNTRKYCFAEDDTGAIYIMRQSLGYDLAAGQVVDVEGITEAGLYAPEILERHATVVGHAALPAPQEVNFEDLAARRFHCRRVEVEGVIRSIDSKWNDGERLDLQIEMGTNRLDAQVYDIPRNQNFDDLLDAKVRLVGVAAGKFNARREFVRPMLEAVGTESLTILGKESKDHFDLPIRPIRELLQFSSDNPAGRTRVRGTLTYQEPGRSLFIRDESGGLLVKTQSSELLVPGDIMDVAGLPAMGAYAPVLQQAVYRRAAHGEECRPRKVTSAEALSGSCDSDLITIRADLVNSMVRQDERVLILKSDGVVFEGRFRLPTGKIQDPNSSRTIDLPAKPAAIIPEIPAHGSVLEVTGICSVPESLEAGVVLVPRSFQLLLRRSADITVIQGPPWWTPQRIAWTFGAMALAIAGSIGWVAALRHRVRQQTEIISRRVHHDAVMQERHRMAREVHDTLVQGFAGISLQLEAVRDKLPTEATVLNRHLEVAHSLARESLVEARRSIWAWHNESLITAGIAASLAASAKSIAGNSGIETRLDASGDFTRLSADVENNLLYIGREAMMNAVKYAHPHLIEIELKCVDGICRLRVRDDGCGFEASRATEEMGMGQGGFGLISMRERAQQIGAEFSLKSEPGKGTELLVTAPLASSVVNS